MSSGQTAQDKTWKAKEQGEEAQYARAKEQEQLQAIRDRLKQDEASTASESTPSDPMDRDFEGGFGGQEDLEDRYATTSGEH